MISASLVAFLFLVPIIKARPSVETQKEVQYFIDGKVIPLHYDVHLTTHVEECEKSCGFEGKIKITVIVNNDIVGKNEKVTQIQLNADSKLEIESCTLQDNNGSHIPVTFSYNKPTEILTVTTGNAHQIHPNKKYFLLFSYKGIHNDNMFGFYKSSYTTSQGVRRWLLTTHFEPNDARNAYPCFDEPKYKATYDFEVTISKKVADEGYHVLFNTPLLKKIENQNGVTFKFRKTPYQISSYLIAFVVSDFKGTDIVHFDSDYGENRTMKKEFQTWGEKRYIENGEAELSQIVGPNALKALTNYVGVGYAYQKMDQIGIPDFGAGAMENWGLVTYRERMLFYNKKMVSVFTKRSTIGTICHELVHQWFGNLVTLDSWNYIWLNEGFAKYLQYVIAEKVAEVALNQSDWQGDGQLIVDDTQLRAMETDALVHSRPMSVNVTNPNVVSSYFDTISYSKAASVLRMWSYALGEDVFRRGLNIYMNDRKEKNSVPAQLLKSFDKACYEMNCMDQNKTGPVSNMFHDWHTTYGYPVISVDKTGSTTYKISQEQFLWFQHNRSTVHNNTWYVPITYTTASALNFDSTKPVFWLDNSGSPANINLPKPEQWILLNNKHIGYYRINYNPENWYALINQLKSNHLKLHAYNRAQLINDAFSFGRSTYKDYNVPYDIPLNMSRYLTKEENYIPWQSALNNFAFLKDKMTTSSEYQNFRKYVLSLVTPQYNRLGLSVTNEKDDLTNMLRMRIGDWACELGHTKCIEDAMQLYKNPGSIVADVKLIVYCTAVREGGYKAFDEVWKLYLKSSENVEQTMYLSALACSKSPQKLLELLNKTITPNSDIRKQDYQSTFSAVYKAGNIKTALDFLVRQFEHIAKNYHGVDPIGTLLIGLSAKLNTEEDKNVLKDLRVKFETSTDEAVRVAAVSVGKSIEIVESNINWIRLKRGSIEKWLSSNVDPRLQF